MPCLIMNDMAKALSRKVTIYINGKEVESTIKSLTAEMNKLKTQQKGMIIGSEEYIKTSLKIKEIESVLKAQKTAIQSLGEDWKNTRKAVADYSTILYGLKVATGKIAGAYNWAKGYVEEAAKMDDAYADVMKTTGLTHDEVLRLNEAFKQMDTRTAREELNKLASEAGKLGITGGDAVASFTAAADKIRVALGEDLGEDATTVIGKMADVYTRSTKELSDAGDDLGAKMLRIGSAINSLGAASSAAEPHMVDFLARLGGMASQAGLSAQQVLGYASALDQSGVSVEKSATAFQNFMAKMMQKPAEFAAIARQGVNEFRQLMETDMDAAIKAVLAGLNEEGGMTKLAPLFKDLQLSGQGVTTMLTTLKGSIDKVNEAQTIANAQMSSGASIEDEFAVKNNTLQAQMEKAKDRFHDTAETLGNALYPAIIGVTNAGSGLMSGFASLAKFVNGNKWILVSFTAALIALNYAKLKKIATDKLDAVQTRISNALTKTGTTLSKIHTAEQERAKLAALKLQKARIALASSNKTVTYSIDGMRISSDKMTAARNIDLAITRQQTVANKSLGAAMKAVPWGWVITAVSVLAPLVYKLFTHQSKVNEAEKEAARQYGEAEGKLKVLFGRLEKASEGSKVYAEALSELKREYPELIQQHIDENGKLKDLKKAYEELSEAAKQSVYDRMYADKSSEVYGDVSKALADAMEKSSKYIDGAFGKLSKAERGNMKKLFNDILVEVSKGEKGLAEAYVAMNLVIKESTGLNMTTGYQRWLVKLADKASEAKETLDALSVSLKPTQDPWELDKKSLEQLNAELEAAKRKLAGYDKQIEAGREGFASKAEMERKHVAALEKAIISLKKAQGDGTTTTTTNSFVDPEDAAKKLKAWEKVKKRAEKMAEKAKTKAESGLEKIKDDVHSKFEAMREEVREAAEEAGRSADATLEKLDKAERVLLNSKIDEFIEKQKKEIEKLQRKTAKDSDNPMLNKVKAAAEQMKQELNSVAEAISAQKDNVATLQDMLLSLRDVEGDEAEASREQLSQQISKFNIQISQYKEIQKMLVASAFASIDTSVDTSDFGKKQQVQHHENTIKSVENLSGIEKFLGVGKSYATLLDEINEKYDKCRRKLEQNIEAEKAMAQAAREAGNEDEAKKHEAIAAALEEEKKGLEGVKEEAEKIARQKSLSKTLENWADMIGEFGDKALSVFSNINSLLKNIADSRLQELEKEKDAEIETLDEQLEQGLISQEDYEERKNELEDNYKAQALEAEKEDWRRQKAYGYSEAIINAAVAATKLWAGEGTTAYKIGMSALLAAEMATQIAAIESQPEPRAKGGYIHNNQLYRVGERGREWIASNSLLNDPATAPVIEALEAYQRGNRRALADVPMAQLNMPVATAAARELGRRTVGAMENTLLSMPTATQKFDVNMPDSGEMMKLWQDLATYLKDPNNRRAVISRQTMTDFEKNEQFLRNKARL